MLHLKQKALSQLLQQKRKADEALSVDAAITEFPPAPPSTVINDSQVILLAVQEKKRHQIEDDTNKIALCRYASSSRSLGSVMSVVEEDNDEDVDWSQCSTPTKRVSGTSLLPPVPLEIRLAELEVQSSQVLQDLDEVGYEINRLAELDLPTDEVDEHKRALLIQSYAVNNELMRLELDLLRKQQHQHVSQIEATATTSPMSQRTPVCDVVLGSTSWTLEQDDLIDTVIRRNSQPFPKTPVSPVLEEEEDGDGVDWKTPFPNFDNLTL